LGQRRSASDYCDDKFEWAIAKSLDRMRRSGFDFHAAIRIFQSNRYIERHDDVHSTGEEDYVIATGMLGPVFVSVVYVERGARKRIFSAFESDDDDIADFMVTYAIEE
jgi:uncharacterized DUF497 family protein